MKKLNLNVANLNATEILSREELKKVLGGNGSEEYCCTVLDIIRDNGENFGSGAWEGAEHAMNTCFGSNGFFPGDRTLNCSQY
jgi:hypothetical protein